MTVGAVTDEMSTREKNTIPKLRADLETYTTSALDIAERLSELKPSRSLSMIRTKLDEAILWGFALDENANEAP